MDPQVPSDETEGRVVAWLKDDVCLGEAELCPCLLHLEVSRDSYLVGELRWVVAAEGDVDGNRGGRGRRQMEADEDHVPCVQAGEESMDHSWVVERLIPSNWVVVGQGDAGRVDQTVVGDMALEAGTVSVSARGDHHKAVEGQHCRHGPEKDGDGVAGSAIQGLASPGRVQVPADQERHCAWAAAQ